VFPIVKVLQQKRKSAPTHPIPKPRTASPLNQLVRVPFKGFFSRTPGPPPFAREFDTGPF